MKKKKNAPSNPPICVANPQHGRFYAAATGGRHAASQAGLRHPRSTVRTAILDWAERPASASEKAWTKEASKIGRDAIE